MDQRSIVLYLARKGLRGTEIHRDLEETLGPEAIAYSTVTFYLRTSRFRIPTEMEEGEAEAEVSPVCEVDEAILKALADEPFSSVRELARHTCLSRTTVHRHLTCSLGFTVRHLRWVPHRLSDSQKTMRVTLSTELLRLLEQQERRAWHDMITLDESWFYFCTDHELIWLAPGETVPERGGHTIQSPKMMVTIAWNTNGFHVLADLPKGVKFNATYYTTEILPHILEWRRTHGTVSTRKLIVHADNARPHTARSSTDFLDANGMKRAPHPSYSADLTPSDFYLFGDVKRRLSGCMFNSRDELLSALEGIL